jgi:hypothetical protein
MKSDGVVPDLLTKLHEFTKQVTLLIGHGLNVYSTYLIDESRISYNRFDDEIIVVNLGTGSYFSMHRTAAEIWRMIESGPASAASIADAFGQPMPAVTSQIQDFLNGLEAKGLLRAVNDPACVSTTSASYSLPVLEEFDELRELLLADIVHDADDAGWPNVTTN